MFKSCFIIIIIVTYVTYKKTDIFQNIIYCSRIFISNVRIQNIIQIIDLIILLTNTIYILKYLRNIILPSTKQYILLVVPMCTLFKKYIILLLYSIETTLYF